MLTRSASPAGRWPAARTAGLSPWVASSAMRAEVTVGSAGRAGLPGNYAGPGGGNPLCQPVTEGVGGGIGPPPGADLAVEVGYVPLDGVRAQAEAAGDLPVGLAGGQPPQHLELPAAEAVRRRNGMPSRGTGHTRRGRRVR